MVVGLWIEVGDDIMGERYFMRKLVIVITRIESLRYQRPNGLIKENICLVNCNMILLKLAIS